MNNKFLHVFLSSNTITIIRVENETKEILFANTNLSSLEKILESLRNLHHYKIKLILDSSQASIKLYTTTGMRFWHRYQLKQRLKKAYHQNDWYSIWEENSNLITLRANLSSEAKVFLEALKEEKFFIILTVPSLWLIHHKLKGHTIKNNGIVIARFPNYFQHILYLNGLPTNCRISKDDHVIDWLQFISLKYKLTLDVLNISQLVTSTESLSDPLISWLLNSLTTKLPPIFFAKQYAVNFYYKCVNLFNQVTYGVVISSILVIIYNINGLLKIQSRDASLEKILTAQTKLLSDFSKPASSFLDFEKYDTKRKTVEAFNYQTFPTMYFLERISTILPEYGQVVYIRIIPTTADNIDKHDLKDTFLIKLKITPFKNSKSFQLLTGEIHKQFGKKIQIHILNQQPNTLIEQAQKLKHTVEINLTGFIHDFQRFIP